MIKTKNQRVLGLITARGGSKRLPGKNIMPMRGKPLIAWTIEAGLGASCIDRLILSSDDPAICDIAGELGCDVPFIRPSHLATDEATSADVVSHALKEIPGFTHVILLQPTSPLRQAHHIDEAFEKMKQTDATTCVAVRECLETPYWMQIMDQQGFITPLMKSLAAQRKQIIPKTYLPNGAIFISQSDYFLENHTFYGQKTVSYLMPLAESVDIDTINDFNLAELSI